jgi:hypothetical protein
MESRPAIRQDELDRGMLAAHLELELDYAGAA